MADTVLAQVAALKTAPVADLKNKWRDLFDTEPPPYNRRFLENRLAYRIQELAYGGLSENAIERLDALADELEGKKPKRPSPLQNRPIAGTRRWSRGAIERRLEGQAAAGSATELLSPFEQWKRGYAH